MNNLGARTVLLVGILILLALGVGYVAGYSLGLSAPQKPQAKPEDVRSLPPFAPKIAQVKGKILSVDSKLNLITIGNVQNKFEQFPLSQQVRITKHVIGASGSITQEQVKTIETGTDAVLTIELNPATEQYRVTAIEYVVKAVRQPTPTIAVQENQ